MSIASNAIRKAGPSPGNGLTTAFPFTFKVFQSADLLVVQTDTLAIETIQTITSQYLVVLNSNQDSNPGGTVTMVLPPPTGYFLTIASQIPNTQPTVLTNNGGFYPTVINDALDRSVALIQQLAEQVNRAVKTSISSTVTPDVLLTSITTNVASSISSATAAQGSATAAQGSATAAQGSATASLNSATASLNSATAAAASATSAAASASTVVASATHAATSDPSPSDADEIPILDSTAAFGLAKLTWLNLKANLKTYLDTLYTALRSSSLQSISSSVASNALTVTYNGGTLDFKNPTSNIGIPNTVIIAANSITAPQGATLGTVSGVSARIAILEAYNAGVPVACITNLAGGLQLDETNLISPTTISTASTSASIIYSNSAVSANSPYRVVGFIDITEATAGTWATAATNVQGAGGQALQQIGKILNSITVATTSGTAIDFTGIPSSVKRITVLFNSVSTSGTSPKLIQIGAGVIANTGYVSTSGGFSTTANTLNSTSGFAIYSQSSTDTVSGIMTLNVISLTNWISSHIAKCQSAFVTLGAGNSSLSGALDRVRITTVNGTDTFTAGLLTINYE